VPDELLARVSKLRELPVKAPIGCLQTASQSELERLLEDTLNKRVTEKELETEGLMLKLLGGIPEDFDYRRNLLAIYSQRMSAFYSPEFKRFVLATGLRSESEEVIAHELTHALQDQHYDLNSLTAPTLSNDLVLARTAIFEGDANLIMRRISSANWCGEKIESIDLVLESLERIIKGEKKVPKFLDLQIALPYFLGERFLCQAIKEGRKQGRSTSVVIHEIFKNLPVSALPLLDREGSWETGPTSDGPLRHDTLRKDTLGPLGIMALLADRITLKEAYAVSSKIKGDSLSLALKKESGSAILSWRIFSETADRAKLINEFEKFYPKNQNSTVSTSIEIEPDGIRIERKSDKIVPSILKE